MKATYAYGIAGLVLMCMGLSIIFTGEGIGKQEHTLRALREDVAKLMEMQREQKRTLAMSIKEMAVSVSNLHKSHGGGGGGGGGGGAGGVESYQAVSCVGIKQTMAKIGIGLPTDFVSSPSGVTCSTFDTIRLKRCLRESFGDTPAEARLKEFALVHHKCGKSMAGMFNDVVTLTVDGGRDFEPTTLKFLLTMVRRLREEVHSVARLVLSEHQIKQARHEDNVQFLDAGMNLASLSIPIWASGTHVRGFEAMPMNVQLLKMSKCMNYDEGMAPFEIVHSPLSSPEMRGKQCQIISHFTNIGDGAMHCAEGERGEGYIRRGIVTMETLDSVVNDKYNTTLDMFLDELKPMEPNQADVIDWTGRKVNVHSVDAIIKFLRRKHRIMKIDVEGHEPLAFKGAQKLLKGPNAPVVILSEVWKSIDMVAYARFMRKFNYRLYLTAKTKDDPTNEDFIFVDDDETCTKHHQGMVQLLINVVFVKKGSEKILDGLPISD